MKPRAALSKEFPLNIVGSNTFGRYPKISVEETFNMIISDDWLVPYAGYAFVLALIAKGFGRGLYSSSRYNHMIAVVDEFVFTISPTLVATMVGTLSTNQGDVFIDENNNNQVAICDKNKLYIYNYSTGVFATATDGVNPTLGFIPGYVTYQDGYFIAPDITPGVSARWRLSNAGNGLIWSINDTGLLQTKADICVATLRFPGRGNMLLVMGKTVTELWNDTGTQLFPYQRQTGINFDYGCVNPATIASSTNLIAFLGQNEKAGPFILYSTGGDIQKISTDGIDFLLANLANPSASYGSLYRQDGHLLYQLTFTDPRDDFTLVYDFNSQKFFTLTNETLNAHIAKKVVFFNNQYYFISTIDGNLYQMGTQFTNFYYGINDVNDQPIYYAIPRIRKCNNVRLPDQSRFVINSLSFTIEQGHAPNFSLPVPAPFPLNYTQNVDLAVSKDGGETFSSYFTQTLNNVGKRVNRLIWYNLGAANDFVPMFRFYGFDRFVATNGIASVYR